LTRAGITIKRELSGTAGKRSRDHVFERAGG
jgi:hypothetical protein